MYFQDPSLNKIIHKHLVGRLKDSLVKWYDMLQNIRIQVGDGNYLPIPQRIICATLSRT